MQDDIVPIAYMNLYLPCMLVHGHKAKSILSLLNRFTSNMFWMERWGVSN